MIGLHLAPGDLTVLAVGAHPDDIEIGCGGTLLALTASRPVTAHLVLLTGVDERLAEARVAAANFLANSRSWELHAHSLPDGRLPGHWDQVKVALEAVAAEVTPDLVFAPRREDAHQDHRLLAELVTTVWRDALVLHYEIPKWDGDLRPVTIYVPLSDETAEHKCRLLQQSYPSQSHRDWWDEETFRGLLRLRGVESRSRYAEGFTSSKMTLNL